MGNRPVVGVQTSKSRGVLTPCQFDSDLRHQNFNKLPAWPSALEGYFFLQSATIPKKFPYYTVCMTHRLCILRLPKRNKPLGLRFLSVTLPLSPSKGLS